MSDEQPTNTVVIDANRLRADLRVTFGRLLVDAEAARIADALVEAERSGVPTHGVLRVPWYLAGLTDGTYRRDGNVTVTHESASLLHVDGHGALGYHPTWLALEPTIDAARANGLAMATVRNIGEFGRASYYASAVADAGLVAVVGQNTIPLLGPPGVDVATHGNNPLAFATPGADGPIFDAAFTPRSGGELRRRAVLGLPLPEEWGYRDADGRPTTDPRAAAAAPQTAIGGAKGFGVALLVDLLAGVLPGAGSGHRVEPGAHVGSFVLVLDPARFPGGDRLADAMADSADHVRAHGGRWPGDRARRARADAISSGTVSIPSPIWVAMTSAVAALE